MRPQSKPSFHNRTQEPCPSCLDREALDLLCRPRKGRTFRCEECGGKGYLLVPKHKQRDPYFIKERIRVGD